MPHPLFAAEYPFGLLLVGPTNDHGWSQAHFEAGQAMEKVFPGAKLIIGNSEDMKDGIREAATMHPKVQFIHISGDDALTGKAGANLSNLIGRMEYCKMMAGFVAALTSKTGKITYLGPLINTETRRLAAASLIPTMMELFPVSTPPRP